MELISFSSFSVVVVGLLRILVSGQLVSSPCPNYFLYKCDGGGVHGVVYVPPDVAVNTLTVRVNFTIAALLSTDYAGKLRPVGNTLSLLRNFYRGNYIEYRVTFPVTSPLPRLTALTVNNNVLCYGSPDVLSRGKQYITSTSIQHTLFLGDHGGPDQFEKQLEDPRFYVIPLPQDTFAETFDDYGDTQDLCNSINNYQPTTTRLVTASPTTTRPTTSSPTTSSPTTIRPTTSSPTTIRPTTSSPTTTRQTTTRPITISPNTQPSPQESQYYPKEMTQPPPPPTWQTPPEPEAKETQSPLPPSPVLATALPQQPVHSRLVSPEPPEESVQCGTIAGVNALIYYGISYARGEWPWLVAIYKRNKISLAFICSGTLVSDRHVITAAHCMRRNTITSSKEIVVKLGVHDLGEWGDGITATRTLESAYAHESYNPTTLANDILVLTFERSVEFNSNIRPACLWTGNPDLSLVVGATGAVAGWGSSENSSVIQSEPRVVRMPIVSTDRCRSTKPDFHKLTSNTTFCAGDRNGSGPCSGDSGGGFYMIEDGRWHIRGVVSLSLRPDNGDSTCNLNEYIVFTDSAQYTSWIRKAMGN